MSRTSRSQLRTSILLVLLIVLCIACGAVSRQKQEKEPVDTTAQAQLSANALRDEQEAALNRYEAHTASQHAQTLTSAEDSAQKAVLLFRGACSRREADALLSLLNTYGVQARFFLSPEEAGMAQEMVSAIRKYGYDVGVAASAGALPEITVKTLVQAAATMQASCGVRPSSLLLLGSPEDELPYAAYAASFDRVFVPTAEVGQEDCGTREKADRFLSRLNRGVLLSVPLGSGGWSAAGLEPLLAALEATDLDVQVSQLLDAAGDREINPAVHSIRTIERSVSFIFSGMGSREELTDLLEVLNAIDAKCQFFLTDEELEQYPTEIRLILSRGHQLGIATLGQGTESRILRELLAAEESLSKHYGITGKPPVLCKIGAAGDALLKAATAGGFTVLTADSMMTWEEDAWRTDVEAISDKVRPDSWGTMKRGEIVHFKLGLYQNSPLVLGGLVKDIAVDHCSYAIRPATDILSNTEMLYTYPVPEDRILPSVKDRIYPGQLTDRSFEALSKRYIGVGWVNSSFKLPGFTSSEIRALDKTGRIPNSGNKVYLTFDDWGRDVNITKILDVLEKHQVKATFFVRTNHVIQNPNLLRAIAAAGHAIGSHTDTHFPLSNQNGGTYESLTEEQVRQLQADVVESYRKLQSIIGDMEVDGEPSLIPVFRPPTLAMSRNGLEAILDCGFTYSLSGSYSTGDYNATSAKALFEKLRANTRKGGVLVMHMSDNSVYTAEALDLYLTYMEKRGNPFEFARVPADLTYDAK